MCIYIYTYVYMYLYMYMYFYMYMYLYMYMYMCIYIFFVFGSSPNAWTLEYCHPAPSNFMSTPDSLLLLITKHY